MPRIIEVIVSPTGETTIQTKGFSGNECLEASRSLERALGLTQSDQKTAEYFRAQQSEQHLSQQ